MHNQKILINEKYKVLPPSFKNLNDLIKVFKKLDKDKKTKVIILEGSGKGFSAGHNLKEVKNLKVRNKYQKLFNLCSKLMLQIVEGKKPVIAKVHGAAFAAGLAIGYWEDIDEIRNIWLKEKQWSPTMSTNKIETYYSKWKQTVEKSLNWIS